MPYGEMRFDDEEELDQAICKFCGKSGDHEPDCVEVEQYKIDTADNDYD